MTIKMLDEIQAILFFEGTSVVGETFRGKDGLVLHLGKESGDYHVIFYKDGRREKVMTPTRERN